MDHAGKFEAKALRAMLTRLEEMKRLSVVVGVPAAKNARREGSVNNATLAAAHEFGVSGHLPERSFLRSTLSENADAAATMLAQGMQAVLVKGEEPRRPFEAVGHALSDLVKQKIHAGIAPPLAESTQRQRKKKAGYLSKKQQAARRSRGLTPLIDTGGLIQSITYEVRDD